MKNTMRHEGFIGSVQYSPEDECFHGRIEGIDDLVSFEGRSVAELKKSFKEAVEDYLELCRTTGKEPARSYKGSFNVRISPELHKRAVRKSISEGISLNRLVRQALEKEVGMTGHRHVKDSDIDAMVEDIYKARTKTRARKPPF